MKSESGNAPLATGRLENKENNSMDKIEQPDRQVKAKVRSRWRDLRDLQNENLVGVYLELGGRP